MRLTKEALSVGIVVRRVGVGSAPFGWEIHRLDTMVLAHASPDRYKSMDAAYQAGLARLADFIPRRSLPPGITENRERQSQALGILAHEHAA
jgi:hypothetical protein